MKARRARRWRGGAAALASLLLSLDLAGAARATTPIPYRGAFRQQIERTFLADETLAPERFRRVSPEKVAAYRAFARGKLHFILSHVERSEQVEKGEDDREAREEAEEADDTVALRTLLSRLDELEAARDPARVYELAAEVLMLDYATRSYTDALGSIQIPVHIWNMALEQSVPAATRAGAASREAGNLVDPETGAFLTTPELEERVRRGEDLSLLDPPAETPFWRAKPDISRVDVVANYLEGGHPVYEGIRLPVPRYRGAVFEYRRAHKTQSKPKLDAYYLSPACRERKKKERKACRLKVKLKFGMETHADPVANALLAALGFNVDVSVHLEQLRVELGDASYEELAADWAGYFDRQRLHTYIPLESVVLERGRDEQGEYVVFREGVVEIKPGEVLRLGFFSFSSGMATEAREARGLQIFNAWIANADMKDEENNKLSLRRDDDGRWHIYLVQQDVGHSMGYVLPERANAFPWSLVEGGAEGWLAALRGRVELNYVNLQQTGLEHIPTYADCRWMVRRIAQLTRRQIEDAVALGHYPGGIGPLYVEKLANRRNQLVRAFHLEDEFALLPVERHLSTDDGSVVDGELVQTRWPHSSIEYGHHWRDVLQPAGRFLLDKLLRLLQISVASVDVVSPGEVRILDQMDFEPDLLLNVSRQVQLNPHPEGARDQYIVEDSLVLGVRPRIGWAAYAEGALTWKWALAYPAATEHEAVRGRNRILPLLLPLDFWRGRLPKRYVLYREWGHRLGGRLRTEEASIHGFFDIDASSGWVRSHRSVLDARESDPLLWTDEPSYLENAARAYFHVAGIEIPFIIEERRRGGLSGEIRILDRDRLDLPGASGDPVFDDVVRRADFREVSGLLASPPQRLRSHFRLRDGRWNLFFALWRSRMRQERIELVDAEGAPLREEYRSERREHFSWSFIDNGETHDLAVQAFANEDPRAEGAAPAIALDFAIDDLNTHSDELDRYYAFLQGLAADRGLLAPDFDATSWEVSGRPGGRWTRVLGYGSVRLRGRALERLERVEAAAYWGDFARTSGLDAGALRSHAEALRRALPKERMRLRRSRAGQEVARPVRRSLRVLAALRDARRAEDPEERLDDLVRALADASYRRGGTFDPTILAALFEAIGIDELADSGELLVAGRITKAFEDELNLPERRALVGRLGAGPPLRELRYPHFPFDGVELWTMLDWVRDQPAPESPAFDRSPPVR